MDKTLNIEVKFLFQYSDVSLPWPPNFHLEIDTYVELYENGVHNFQQHIGVLLWEIELGRIDILTEVITFSQKICSPRVNNLEALYNIYHYIRKNMKLNPGRVVYDPTLQ